MECSTIPLLRKRPAVSRESISVYRWLCQQEAGGPRKVLGNQRQLRLFRADLRCCRCHLADRATDRFIVEGGGGIGYWTADTESETGFGLIVGASGVVFNRGKHNLLVGIEYRAGIYGLRHSPQPRLHRRLPVSQAIARSGLGARRAQVQVPVDAVLCRLGRGDGGENRPSKRPALPTPGSRNPRGPRWPMVLSSYLGSDAVDHSRVVVRVDHHDKALSRLGEREQRRVQPGIAAVVTERPRGAAARDPEAQAVAARGGAPSRPPRCFRRVRSVSRSPQWAH